ncbi:hypothetical protein FDECE_17966 [Fusarium decemcellulare]|nr:hypothetical protein FDECE_17966 [Fusarium decemcellulare]
MNTRKSRQYRRVAQACDNCRRKKIRCPGQKPSCSACTRLGQQCRYPDGGHSSEQPPTEIEGRVVARLSQLEEKLDMIIGRVETPLPSEIIGRAIEIYFERIHRQPLWLFEAESPPTPNSSEELICAILALSLTCSAMDFADSNLKSPDFYGNNARRLVMLKIADGDVGIQSLQVLCLVAFLNVLSDDLPLAGLNTAFVKNATQYSALKHQSQEMSRLFWSISLLDTFYSPPAMVPCLDDIHSPRYSTLHGRLTSMPCPPMPKESYGTQQAALPDIWPHCVRVCNLWADVRLYISRCIEGLAEAPWQPTSDYTAISSRLLNLEIAFPTSLSYNTVKFTDRSAQEVQNNRAEWLPWLRVQVTYHTIQCVLNHPFLYTFKASKRRLGSNTFWRSSYEKALRHCTWVSRLIRMARGKGFQLTDPFFAQAAGIAGSLHLYWVRGSDGELKNAASANLEICTTLIADMASHWPICVAIERALNQFINLLNPPNQQDDSEDITVAAKTSLMWVILDITAPQFPTFSGDREDGNSYWTTEHDGREYTAFDDPDIQTPTTDIRESTAHYASPPEWVSRTGGANSPCDTQMDMSSTHHENFTSSLHGFLSDHQGNLGGIDLSWGPWESAMRLRDNSMASLDWWNFGNL